MKASRAVSLLTLLSLTTGALSSCNCVCTLCSGVSSTVPQSAAACSLFCQSEGCGANNYEHSCKSSSSDDCLTGKTLLYSCDRQQAVEARDVVLGEALHALDKEHNKVICSEVYYVYHHKDREPAEIAEQSHNVVKLTLEGDDTEDIVEVEVSPNHLVYTVGLNGEHETLRAKLVQPGDEMLISNRNGNQKEVVVMNVEKIQSENPGLTNILTFEPALVLHNGVVLSAYSYDETWYDALFAPLRFVYRNLGGAEAVEAMIPTIRAFEQSSIGNYALHWVASAE